VAARLKPGVTLEQGKERLQASASEFRVKFPLVLGAKGGFSLRTFREFFIGDVEMLLEVLLSAVGLVLLIACANVANLLLVPGANRRCEIGIRAAIGATRGRIARQLLIESILLALVSGAFGLLLGYGGIRALLIGNAEGLQRMAENGAAVFLDWRLLAFALAASLLAALLFGLFPALHLRTVPRSQDLERQTVLPLQRNAGTTVSPGFFDVFKIPVTHGRAFTERDGASAPPVAMINETMAKIYFKDRDPLKDRIVIGRKLMKEFQDEPARQIIGIAADVRDTGLSNTPRPVMYVPWAQLPDVADAFWNEPMAWVVRTQTPPQKLVPAIQEQVRQATGVPVSDVLLMDQVVAQSTTRQRFSMLLMTIFGCAALLLAAIGIYGLMAHTVEQRTQEIGIRLALGAEATQLRNMVVRQGMSLALAGVVIGLGAAWGVSRLMESLLFGVKPRDPVVFVAVPVALSAVPLLSVWLPARRALRVDPAVALRHD
jgi:cell division protein FtsX